METPSECGCAESCEEPLVCLLAGREAQEQRLADFRALFVHLERTVPRPGSFTWHFRAETAEVEAQVRAIAANEQACCPFFRFSIHREGASVLWQVSAPQRAHEVMAAFMLLPETLRSGVDADALKVALTDAGLRFVEDAQ